jgi:hypothetical protein
MNAGSLACHKRDAKAEKTQCSVYGATKSSNICDTQVAQTHLPSLVEA